MKKFVMNKKNAIFQTNYTLKLLIVFKIAYFCCFI